MTDKNNISNVQRTGILITLLTATFITSMSITVTGNMIPNFIAYFGVSSNLAQWLTSGAALISGVTIPITAFLIKRTPNKMYFLSAMTVFTIGSMAAYSMASMLSSVVGPTYAGLVMDSFGWQGVFVSLFVIGILIIIGGIAFIENITDKEDAPLYDVNQS